MWINIDRERMVVTHKHENRTCVDNLAYIELGHSAVVTMEDSHLDAFRTFTDFELKLLIENMCGQKHVGYHLDPLIQSASSLCKMVKPTVVNELEAAIQADRLPVKRDKDEYYKYTIGSNDASYVQDLFKPSALTTVAGYVPSESIMNFVSPNDKIRNTKREAVESGANPYITPAEAATPRAPRAPKEPGAVEAAPKTGSKTGRVWDIADDIKTKNESLDAKMLRKLIIAACEAEGINGSTASVQYSKWKTARNIA